MQIYLGQYWGKTHLTQKILPGVGEGQTMNDSFKRIGKQLQAARKERALRLADVARELRISADYLKLLELGDFDQLPAPTYVSGFLRSYGKFLGMDGADLAGRFYAIKGDASAKMDYKLPVTAGPPQRSAPAVASLFVVLALVGYGGWYWISGPATPEANVEGELAVVEMDRTQPGQMEKNAIGQGLEAATDTTSSAPADKDSTVMIAQDAVESTAPIIKAGGDNATAANTATATAVKPTTLVSSPDITVPANNDAAELNVTPDAATQPVTKIASRENLDDAAVIPGLDQRLAPGRGAAVATSRDPDQEVTIRATASSWVEIVRGDGTAVLKKLMKTGETYIVDDGSALYLSTGNAGGIELVTANNDIITIGAIGEIVRDLPLAKNRLRERF